jgi:uncharacterized membrane protein HdeD (DUF308 family)
MIDVLARNWGWVALRGGAALMFGLIALFNPRITLAALVLLFGAYALVDGAFNVFSAIAHRREQPHWVSLLIGGVVGIVAGVLTFLWPAISAMALLFLIAAWALLVGVLEIGAAVRLRKVITGEWLLVLSGVLSVLLGLLLFAFPATGALAVVMWIGAFSLVHGVLLLALGFRLRTWNRTHPTTTGMPRPA